MSSGALCTSSASWDKGLISCSCCARIHHFLKACPIHLALPLFACIIARHRLTPISLLPPPRQLVPRKTAKLDFEGPRRGLDVKGLHYSLRQQKIEMAQAHYRRHYGPNRSLRLPPDPTFTHPYLCTVLESWQGPGLLQHASFYVWEGQKAFQ